MEPLDPTSTAIVVVHAQNDIVAGDGAFAPFFRAEIERVDTLGRISRLLEAARAAGATVVYTRVAWAPDYSDLVANSPLLQLVTQQNCLVEGTIGAQIAAEVAPRDGDVVVTHKRPGGFHNSDLHDVLTRLGARTVAFAGVATNASVEGTARGASDLGYRTVLLADCCSAATQAAHQASLESMGLLAEVVSAAELQAAWA